MGAHPSLPASKLKSPDVLELSQAAVLSQRRCKHSRSRGADPAPVKTASAPLGPTEKGWVLADGRQPQEENTRKKRERGKGQEFPLGEWYSICSTKKGVAEQHDRKEKKK